MDRNTVLADAIQVNGEYVNNEHGQKRVSLMIGIKYVIDEGENMCCLNRECAGVFKRV